MVMWPSNRCLYFNENICHVLNSGEKNVNCDYFMSIGEAHYKLCNS